MLLLPDDDRRAERLEPGILMSVEPLSPEEQWQELEELYEDAIKLLAGLDRLALFQAGAHLAMAIEAMRQRYPKLRSPD